MEQKPSLVGGACIIAGVCVGAGMLGLPSAGAGAWSLWSMLAVALTMVFFFFVDSILAYGERLLVGAA